MHGTATHLNETTTPTPTNANHRRHHQPQQEQQRLYMLGSAAFRFSVCGGGAASGSTRLICRHPSAATARDAASASAASWPSFSSLSSSSASASAYHSSNCLLANHGSVGGTIWHSLLPSSSCLAVGSDKISLSAVGSSSSSRNLVVAGSASNRGGGAGVALTSGIVLNGRFIGNGSGFSDGSWNVAWDARPARWLHGRHSAWLLFGFCSCFTTNGTVACCEGNSSSSPSSLSDPPALGPAPKAGEAEQESEAKKVYNDFKVIGIPGDGRCLFRAVAHGICTRNGKPTNEEDAQRELADDLRSKVVDELVKRRTETEWFIEGNFDEYTERMREPHVWGGEPELLMLSHVLKVPITVYMKDRNSDGVIAIAEYGQEYAKEDERPFRVLYHGFGHYDALHMPGDNAENLQSKL